MTDYEMNPDVCPSSLGEDGTPMTEGETAHKLNERGVCDECGAIPDEKLTASRRVVLAVGLLKRYRDRRADDLQMHRSVEGISAGAKEHAARAVQDLQDLDEAIEYIGSLTLGDLTN